MLILSDVVKPHPNKTNRIWRCGGGGGEEEAGQEQFFPLYIYIKRKPMSLFMYLKKLNVNLKKS